MTTAMRAVQAAKFAEMRKALLRLKAAVARLPSKADSVADAVARWLDEEMA